MDRQHTFVATIDIKSFWEKSKPLLMKVDSDFEEHSVTIICRYLLTYTRILAYPIPFTKYFYINGSVIDEQVHKAMQIKLGLSFQLAKSFEQGEVPFSIQQAVLFSIYHQLLSSGFLAFLACMEDYEGLMVIKTMPQVDRRFYVVKLKSIIIDTNNIGSLHFDILCFRMLPLIILHYIMPNVAAPNNDDGVDELFSQDIWCNEFDIFADDNDDMIGNNITNAKEVSNSNKPNKPQTHSEPTHNQPIKPSIQATEEEEHSLPQNAVLYPIHQQVEIRSISEIKIHTNQDRNGFITPWEQQEQNRGCKQYVPNNYSRFVLYWKLIYGIDIVPSLDDTIAVATVYDGTNEHIVPIEALVRSMGEIPRLPQIAEQYIITTIQSSFQSSFIDLVASIESIETHRQKYHTIHQDKAMSNSFQNQGIFMKATSLYLIPKHRLQQKPQEYALSPSTQRKKKKSL